MLKKTITVTVAVVLALGLVSGTARAEEKIALVSLQRALNEVNEGKQAAARLKKEYETKKKEIDGLRGEIETLTKSFEKDRMVLSEDALKTKQQGLQQKVVDLQNKASTYEKELLTKENESKSRIIMSLRQVVNDISEKDGFTLVIENSTDTVLFSKNATDITDKVIASFNKK